MLHTLPPKLSSPVIARSWTIGLLSAKLIKAVAIVTPAEGPSLAIAPSVK